MERKISKEISQDEWYIPYKDVIYRLDGYVISDLEEASYPEFDVYHQLHIKQRGSLVKGERHIFCSFRKRSVLVNNVA